mgnify:CR=1 FL=1
MDEEELMKKMERLEYFETKERKKQRWRPYVELEAHLAHMYACRNRLETAAIHQDEADEISSEFDLGLTTYGRADIWDAHADLEAQLESKEKESEALYTRLALEEEE